MRILILATIFMTANVRLSIAQEFRQPSTLPPAPCACGESPCMKTICVPEPARVKTTKPIYDVNLKPYCLPKCPISFGALLGYCGCGEGCCCTCGHPHVRHILMKRFVTEEHQTCKCVPVCVPACPQCAGPCGPAGGGCGCNPALPGEAFAIPGNVAPLPGPAAPK